MKTLAGSSELSATRRFKSHSEPFVEENNGIVGCASVNVIGGLHYCT